MKKDPKTGKPKWLTEIHKKMDIRLVLQEKITEHMKDPEMTPGLLSRLIMLDFEVLPYPPRTKLDN